MECGQEPQVGGDESCDYLPYSTTTRLFINQCRHNDLEHVLETLNNIPPEQKLTALRAGIIFICRQNHLDMMKLIYPIYRLSLSNISSDDLIAEVGCVYSICVPDYENALQLMIEHDFLQCLIDRGLLITHWYCSSVWKNRQFRIIDLLLSRKLSSPRIDMFFDTNVQLHTKLEWYLNHGLNPSLVPGKIMKARYEVMAKEKEDKIAKLSQCGMCTGLCRDIMVVCAQFIGFG